MKLLPIVITFSNLDVLRTIASRSQIDSIQFNWSGWRWPGTHATCTHTRGTILTILRSLPLIRATGDRSVYIFSIVYLERTGVRLLWQFWRVHFRFTVNTYWSFHIKSFTYDYLLIPNEPRDKFSPEGSGRFFSTFVRKYSLNRFLNGFLSFSSKDVVVFLIGGAPMSSVLAPIWSEFVLLALSVDKYRNTWN